MEFVVVADLSLLSKGARPEVEIYRGGSEKQAQQHRDEVREWVGRFALQGAYFVRTIEYGSPQRETRRTWEVNRFEG